MTSQTATQPKAPGDTDTPYKFPPATQWAPVIYYSVGEVKPGEGPIWLVEPYPAARADGSDGLDFDYMGESSVAVLRGAAAPRPRATRDGEWIVPGKAEARDCAYDERAVNQADLFTRWVEAYAIAAALNAGVSGIKPEDVEVLLAAEATRLTGDSRFAGTINELRWKGRTGTRSTRVPVRQARRLRDELRLIEVRSTERREPRRKGEFSSAGQDYTISTFGLTIAGHQMLAEIRAYGRIRTVRFVIDSKFAGGEWSLYEEGTVASPEQDPNEIAKTIAISQGIPPGTRAHIAWNAMVRVRVWTGPGEDPDGEYLYDALAKFRDNQ
ncbi:hypothetical protein AB0F93_03660 [Micromonospora tulbaghiae]|uniref:hypothetical protein n=1 Tax=Micromonospora tulbaghiae TaxID=479978 RepID=UPI00331E8DCF